MSFGVTTGWANEFPQLLRPVDGHRLVYLDSAATTLKPVPVIAALTEHFSHGAANVHRGAHTLSDRATAQFEDTRQKVARLVGAGESSEIIFTHGTTEGLNLLASSLGDLLLAKDDVILLSQMEHHSNIVPWQRAAERKGAKVLFAPVLANGTLDVEAFSRLLTTAPVKIVSLVHASNALGTINPLKALFQLAHERGAVTVADAAQSVATLPLNVQDLGCDFLVFSGHKIFAPTGVGGLYGKLDWLERLEPYQGGGSMIAEVTEQGSTYLKAPHRFEAGTPPIGEVIALGAALDFVTGIGLEIIQKYEHALLEFALAELSKIEAFRPIGTASEKVPIVSFLLGEVHPADVGATLNEQGVAVRTGHHCCQPLMRRLGVSGTVRASFSIYNGEQDVLDLVRALRKVQELFI